jgi:spore germination cell wall hydrolase CwlJ-like protein
VRRGPIPDGPSDGPPHGPYLAEHTKCLYVSSFMTDSPAKEVALSRTGNRDECHADSSLVGHPTTFCVGVAVAVAVVWQSDAGIARQIVATSYEQFSSIAPRAAQIADNTSDIIAMAAQAASSSDGQQLRATPFGLAGVPTRPPSRIRYQDATAPNVKQEVVREGFPAHLQTRASKWSACRRELQMMGILHVSIHPHPKFQRHGWWTATVGRRWQPRRAKSISRPRTAPARIDFRTARLGRTPPTPEPWVPEKAPMLEPQEPDSAVVAPHMVLPFQPPRNEAIVPGDEVTGKDHWPASPAERLGLIGAARAKHEKCLADAVYFEARGEPVRGQMAVAQVVINRVFSGYYPNNICEVVYQNTHRHLRCQFTFACDGRPERVDEPAAWGRAQRIARDALDGNFWLNDVGQATHYRAPWVHPRWVRKMRKLDRVGVHTFYRPRNWGDGANSPTEVTKRMGNAL